MRVVRGFAAAASALLALIAAPAGAQVPTLAPSETLLLVQGKGEASATPDIMLINAGVITVAATPAAALDANNRQADRLLAAVRAAGVEARDVRTEDLSVYPNYSDADDDENTRIVSYTARNELKLRLRDVQKAGTIISSLFDAGANSVHGPYFTVAEDRALGQAALRDAVADARVNGTLIASALGKRIVRVLKVRDADVQDDGPGRTVIITGSRIAPTPIAPGEVTVTASVVVEFALAD